MLELKNHKTIERFSCFLLCACLLVMLCIPVASKECVYYVSPDGSDTATGSIEAPLATLSRAVELVKGTGATIYLRGGVYKVTDTVKMNEEHSGISIRAYRGEEVTVTGAEPIDSSWFKKVTDKAVLDRIVTASAKDKIYAADLKAHGITEYGKMAVTRYDADENGALTQNADSSMPMLYINHKLQSIARYPNDGYLNIDEVVKKGSVPRYMSTPLKNLEGFEIRCSDKRISKWSLNDVFYAEGYWMHDWHRQSFEVSIDFDNKNTIKSEFPAHYGVTEDRRFYFYNLIEELDKSGEWYLDRENGVLYICADKTPDKDDCIDLVTTDAPFIELKNAKNVTVSGIRFTCNLNYAINMTTVDNVSINNCEFSLVTGTAVNGKGVNTEIRSCYFHDLGRGAIYLKGGDRITLTPGNNEIINNAIERFQLYDSNMNYPGIQIDGSVGARIAHNKISYGAAEAIYYRGNENIIEYNDIGFVCQNTADQGIIHTGRDWTQRGNIIRYNYFHDIELMDTNTGMTATGVYLDDMHSSTHVYGNVMYKLSQICLFGGGRDNIFENNIMLECAYPFTLDARGTTWMDTGEDSEIYKKLVKIPYDTGIWKEKYPEISEVLTNNPTYPMGNIIRNNVQYKSPGYDIHELALENGVFENNIEISNTKGFVDYSGKDFTLTDDSEIFAKLPDFEPVPFEKIGLLDDEVKRVKDNSVTLLIGSPRTVAKGKLTRVDAENPDVCPIIYEGRTLVPLCFIAESFGAEVSWVGETKTITVKSGEDTVTFALNSKAMDINGAVTELDVPALSINDRSLIPLRAMVEALGKNVFWDNRGLIVISDDKEPVKSDDEFIIRELIDSIS